MQASDASAAQPRYDWRAHVGMFRKKCSGMHLDRVAVVGRAARGRPCGGFAHSPISGHGWMDRSCILCEQLVADVFAVSLQWHGHRSTVSRTANRSCNECDHPQVCCGLNFVQLPLRPKTQLGAAMADSVDFLSDDSDMDEDGDGDTQRYNQEQLEEELSALVALDRADDAAEMEVLEDNDSEEFAWQTSLLP